MRVALLVLAKELRETLRDPHVIIFLAFPLILYPMMIWGGVQLAMLEQGWSEGQTYQIGADGPADFLALLDDHEQIERVPGGIEALERGELDAVAVATETGESLQTVVHHRSQDRRSRAAEKLIRRELRKLRTDRTAALAAAHGLNEDDLSPLEIESEVLTGDAEWLGAIMATIVSIMAPMSMLITGIYPAVELVVSERERGTLETTLVAPSPRSMVLLGKVLACTFLMLVAAAGNLFALGLTLSHLNLLVLESDSIWYVPPLLPMLLSLPAVFASAVLCASGLMLSMIPARNFKEGEYAGSIVLMIGIVPILGAAIALMADGGNGLLAVPLANTVIVLHHAVMGTLTVVAALAVTAENALVAGVVLAIGAAITNREDYLLAGRLPRWLQWLHRNEAS